MQAKPFMNAYLAGFLLGLVLLTTIYISGHGLGASGGTKSLVVSAVKTVIPDHFTDAPYYKALDSQSSDKPLVSWMFFEIIGVFIGALFSGIISDRVNLKLEKGKGVGNHTRIIGAIIGGLLFGFGSQLGRGCTSGSALSGMAVMSFGGIITMLSIFGAAYLLAYFFKNLWTNK